MAVESIALPHRSLGVLARSFFPYKQMSLREQLAHMRFRWPEFDSRLRGDRLVCRGQIRPTPLHATYDARITLGPNGIPKIFVDAPALVRRNIDQPIPHTYTDLEICAFHPLEWASNLLLALTAVPWTYRWLHVYEIWRITGEWDAFGVHPT